MALRTAGLVEGDGPGLSARRLGMIGRRTRDAAHLQVHDGRGRRATASAPKAPASPSRCGPSPRSVRATPRSCRARPGPAGRRRWRAPARLREAILENPAIRHRLVDLRMSIRAAEALLETSARRAAASQPSQRVAAWIAMDRSATAAAVQIHARHGRVIGAPVARPFRDCGPRSIGGGSTEIHRDRDARQMGPSGRDADAPARHARAPTRDARPRDTGTPPGRPARCGDDGDRAGAHGRANPGAAVTRVARTPRLPDPAARPRRSKSRRALKPAARSRTAEADMLIEGFRPMVMERLGTGPGLAADWRRILGRMTGWGQEGPQAPVRPLPDRHIAEGGALLPPHINGPRC